MRRIVLGLAGVVALLVAAAATLVSRAPLDSAGETMLAGLREATGLQVEANGGSRVSLFPSPRIHIEGVSVARPGEQPFAVARELVGALDVGALIAGRLELGEFTLQEPQIALDRIPYADMLAALRRRTGGFAPPEIRIADGLLSANGRVIDKVEAGLAWPRSAGPLAVSGFGRFAGQPVEATLQLADLSAFARRERAPFRARITGGGARVLFDGEAVDENGLKLAGEVSARAASLADTLGWLGARAAKSGGRTSTPQSSTPQTWSVSFAGRGSLDASGLQISNAELEIGGESFLGAGRLTTTAAGPAIEATLDADALDLGPYVDLLSPELRRADGGWSAASIDLAGLDGWTLDLRLSAEELKLGRLRLDDPALTVAVAKGGLDMSIGEARAYGGALGGRLSLEPAESATRLRLEGGVTDVAADDAIGLMIQKSPISGALNAEFSVESLGGSMVELVAGLKGKAQARIVDGALVKIGRSRTLALAGLNDHMDFSVAEARMAIANGVANADSVSIVGPDATFALAGQASLVDRDLKLRGTVRPAEGGWTLPVLVEGPLKSPKLKPDLTGRGPRGEARRDQNGATVR